MTADPTPGLDDLVRYLATLAGPQPAGYYDIRQRRAGDGEMRQRFYTAHRPRAAAAAIRSLARSGDVYVGCTPRRERAGGKHAIEHAWVLWVDCDTPESITKLEQFRPAPSIVVRSGRGRHAYWSLAEPLIPEDLERANRRLAHHLGADPVCAEAARVLRPPATLNHKYHPPVPVTLEFITGELLAAATVVANLPEPPQHSPVRTRRSERDPAGDPLLLIEPAIYVEALTGQRVGRSRKVSCPLHEDADPSLTVFRTPAGGWFCFGCRAGTSVYDLGAAVLGIEPRGRQMHELRRRLYEILLPDVEPPTRGRRGTPRPRRSARRPVGAPSTSG